MNSGSPVQSSVRKKARSGGKRVSAHVRKIREIRADRRTVIGSVFGLGPYHERLVVAILHQLVFLEEVSSLA